MDLVLTTIWRSIKLKNMDNIFLIVTIFVRCICALEFIKKLSNTKKLALEKYVKSYLLSLRCSISSSDNMRV